ncbi:MAG: hypothetical protein IT285_07825 [Bdellovibrionales bacterium]|nr:hypothetical protein [Bdellovibrionales bacterium]
MSKKFAYLFAFLAMVAPSINGKANGYTPMIEVGSGVSTGVTSEGLVGADILVHVGFSLWDSDMLDPTGGGAFGPTGFYLVKIRGDAQFATSGGPNTFSYMDVSIVPLGVDIVIQDMGDRLVVAGLQLLPVNLNRNVYIDNEFGARVHLIGAHVGSQWNISENFAFYADLSAKLLGYKMRMHLNDALSNFHGASIAELGLELGTLIQIGQVDLRLFAGVGSDVALGSANGSFAASFDPTVYAGLAVDISEVIRKALPWVGGLEFFVKGAYTHAIETGSNDFSQGSGVLLGGFTIRF